MKLHANAALSLNKRRVLVGGSSSGVVADEGGRGRRSQRPHCARKWVGRYLAEGERGLLDRSSAPQHGRQPHRRAACPGDRRVAPAALHRRRDRRGASGWRSRRCRGSCTRIGMGKLGRLGLEPARCATSASAPASCCTSTSRSSGASSAAPDTGSRGQRRYNPTTTEHGGIRRGRSAGSSCTSPSTTAPAWPTPKCSADEKATTAIGFLRRAIAFFERHGITVERCSPITARPTAPPSTPSPAAPSASVTCAPARDAHRPTARPNASSAPCSAAGPTARSTATAANAAVEFPRFRGHLIAGPSGPAARIDVHAVNPAVFA